MIRSSVILIPLAAIAVALSCSSEDGSRPPTSGNLPTGSATTGTGGDGGGQGGTGGQGGDGGGTGGDGGGTGGDGGGTGGDGGGQGGADGQGGGTGGGGGEPLASCTNGVKDGGESDLDCGGSCPPCVDGQACAAPTDCVSRRCEEDAGGGSAGSGGSGGSAGTTCAAAQCDNGVRDGDETDTDCGRGASPRGGNPACPPCADLQDCAVGSDCESLSCVAGRCLSPSCSDGVKNGNETGIDCGDLCAGCAAGEACSNSTDCSDLVCIEQVCLSASCSDGVKNGKETDIDCGGTVCRTRCPAGQGCTAGTDCATSLCNSATRTCACPQGMVIAPVAGGGSYCIDQYEATKQEYDVFMQASPPAPPGLPAECAGNIYQPSNGWPYTEGRTPINYVDWCDAYVYCAYRGKHLCGRIGGGASSPAELANAEQNEWYNACSGQGVNEYPYGHVYEPKCKVDAPTGDFALKSVGPAPVPPVSTCEGGATGLYHMSGNAAEWEDSCDTEGNCLVRGGSRASVRDAVDIEDGSFKAARCDASLSAPRRDNTDPNISFRCCL
ncbi:formylglycine-generating enzyme family protein [Sorangium sp. So ce887]|uniref:formylglycine-generating enzyme family protein n=1 Tax=Sorangium sp. So ce887 TaxID=3133324 RepID=UPI003F606380